MPLFLWGFLRVRDSGTTVAGTGKDVDNRAGAGRNAGASCRGVAPRHDRFTSGQVTSLRESVVAKLLVRLRRIRETLLLGKLPRAFALLGLFAPRIAGRADAAVRVAVGADHRRGGRRGRLRRRRRSGGRRRLSRTGAQCECAGDRCGKRRGR